MTITIKSMFCHSLWHPLYCLNFPLLNKGKTLVILDIYGYRSVVCISMLHCQTGSFLWELFNLKGFLQILNADIKKIFFLFQTFSLNRRNIFVNDTNVRKSEKNVLKGSTVIYSIHLPKA